MKRGPDSRTRTGRLTCVIQARVVVTLLVATLAGCQRPPDPLAAAPMFYPPVPAPVVQERPREVRRAPSVADFIEFAGSTSVYFEGDRVELDEIARAVLDRQAEWLLQNPDVTASLEGHADAYGSRERQFAIGEMRAAAMRRYLVAKGVSSSRLQITSFGKEFPRSLDRDPAGQRLNRRGDTVLQGIVGTRAD